MIVLQRELNVHQSHDVQRAGQRVGVGTEFIEVFPGNVVRRQHAGAVARMHAGAFYMLHDPADHHRRIVGHGVHVELMRVFEKTVDEDGMLRRCLNRLLHIAEKRIALVDDDHGPPAEDVRGPDKHRIADVVGPR